MAHTHTHTHANTIIGEHRQVLSVHHQAQLQWQGLLQTGNYAGARARKHTHTHAHVHKLCHAHIHTHIQLKIYKELLEVVFPAELRAKEKGAQTKYDNWVAVWAQWAKILVKPCTPTRTQCAHTHTRTRTRTRTRTHTQTEVHHDEPGSQREGREGAPGTG